MMKKVLIGLVILVAALLVAAVVVMQTVDFNEYKGLIAAKAKEATGRDLQIEGDLKLDLLTFSPSIVVDGVRFQNAAWGSRPDMLSLQRFEAQVAVIPLLSGRIKVKRLILIGADILIEKDAQGRANYEFETMQASEAAQREASPASGEAGPLPTVNTVSIEDSVLVYRDAEAGTALELRLDELTLVGESATAPLAIKLAGAYNGEPFSAAGTVGAPAEAQRPTRPWPVNLTVQAAGATVALKGTIEQPMQARGIDLVLDVAGETLARLSPFAGGPVPPIGPYRVAAKIAGDADKQVTLSELMLVAGTSSLAGTVTADLSGQRPRVVANLSSDQLNLADFVKETGDEASRASGDAAAAPRSASPATDGNRVIPDTPLPVAALRAADADIELKVRKILLKDGLAADDVSVVVRLNDGDLTVNPVRLTMAGGLFDSALRLNGATATPQTEFSLRANDIPLANVLRDLGQSDAMEGDLSVDIDLKGSGATVRAVAASLGGKADIVMGNGRMKNTAIDDVVGGLGKFLTELVAGRKSEYTVVNCAVNRFEVTNGLVNTRAMLFDTEYATITGKGTINLANEALAMEIDPRPKAATINTAVPVMVQGTLAAPQVVPNPLAIAGTALGMVGAVAFPPAALIGLADLGTGDAQPCIAMAQTGGEAQQPAASGPVEQIQEGVGKALDGVGDQIKGLFGR